MVDSHKQWFARIWVLIGKKAVLVEFKIDTGCNSVVLSRKTLGKFGLTENDLAKLPITTGIQASGENHPYRKLGAVSLHQSKTTPICKTEAVCHATHETHDLIGTEVFMQFCKLSFNLSGNKYMELLKA
jgi:hypothetical protein